jgi:hypothetical protein
VHRISRFLSSCALVALLAGCGRSAGGPFAAVTPDRPHALSSAAKASPADVPEYPGAGGFVAGLGNPYLGFSPGRVFRYQARTADVNGH